MIGFLLVLAMVQIAVQATSLLILTVAGNPAGAEACIKGFQAAGGGADADDGEARVRHFASALAAQVDYRPVKLSTSKSRHNPAVHMDACAANVELEGSLRNSRHFRFGTEESVRFLASRTLVEFP